MHTKLKHFRAARHLGGGPLRKAPRAGSLRRVEEYPPERGAAYLQSALRAPCPPMPKSGQNDRIAAWSYGPAGGYDGTLLNNLTGRQPAGRLGRGSHRT